MSRDQEAPRKPDLTIPVADVADPWVIRPPEPGIALCLSGGGYRAMVFHAGALLRLNECGYLHKLARISSVSGGSIAAGVLALAWPKLQFDDLNRATNFRDLVVAPICKLASRTIDIPAVLWGVLGPGTVAERIAHYYRKYLFGKATLQDLPDSPRFVFNATSLQSKSLWRFSKTYLWDWRVGKVSQPKVELAVAVGASSAFPPVLSPVVLDLRKMAFEAHSGDSLQRPPFTTEAVLTDGGVYDNLGLETAWKHYDTILVSDGGGMYATEEKPSRGWLQHTRRVFDLIDNQVRSLRKRQLITSFENGTRKGTYWSIWSDIANYQTDANLEARFEKTALLASTPTRLKSLDTVAQQRLLNWGYVICDAALRKHVLPELSASAGFPFPGGVG
jgi:NTE family protein